MDIKKQSSSLKPVKKISAKKPAIAWYHKFGGVKVTEKIFFVQQLSVMLKSGVSLSNAIKTLGDQSGSKYMSFILNDVYHRVDHGQSLTESLALYPKIFDELFVNMLRAGEVSGKYEEVLNQLYLQMKKSHQLKSKIRGAMIYPIIVVIAMICISTAMIVFVIPKLTSIFDEVNVALPLPTRILIYISDFASEYIIFISLAVIAFTVLSIYIFRKEKPKYYLHSFLLKLPILSPIIKKINIARLARTLSSLLKTDIPIIESLRISSRVVGSRPYRQAMLFTAEEVKKGKKIESALREYPNLFPPLITQMVNVGEQTGNLDNILEQISQFFEEEVTQIMDNLPSIIEPILMLLLGLGVGGMAVAIIMPLYSITEVI